MKNKLQYLIFTIACAFMFTGCTSYDADKPDTKNNKAGFERLFGFKPTEDVKNIYYYADEMGIDAIYQLSFDSEIETVDKIINNLNLNKVESSERVGYSNIAEDFAWWNDEQIQKIPEFYYKRDSNSNYKYLWLDRENKKVYYLSFST